MLQSLFLILLSLSFAHPKNVFAHSQTQVIEMTPEGFQPDLVTVDENSTIIFINKDSQPHWPASNPHPTHDLYPEFDPRKPIQPGESWPFKPKKVGEWKYHDHMFPHMRGVIIVLGEKSSAASPTRQNLTLKTFISQFKDTVNNLFTKLKSFFSFKNISNPEASGQKQLPDREDFKKLSYDMQTKELKEIAQSNGAARAWQYLQDAFKDEGGSSGNIHDLAHLAGILMYEKRGFEGIKDCSSKFAFGCYHGFLDKAFSKNLDHLLDAQNACLKLGPDNNSGPRSVVTNVTGPVASCIHGIGHGIASYYATSDIKKALSSCRKLTTGNEYCFDGVFMEFVRSAPDEFFKKDDLLYPCNALEKEFGYAYSFACGRNQPSLLMGRFNIGFEGVVSVCQGADSKPFQQACFDSLGFSLAATTDVEKIISGCQKIGVPEYVNRCTKAAAGELVFQEVPGWEEKSEAVCNGFAQGRSECLSHVDRLIKEYNRPKKIIFAPMQDGEDVNLYIRRQVKVCYDIGGRDGCYKQVAGLLYDNFGLSKTLALLKANEDYPEIYARCHEVTHYLSRLEYEKQGNIAKVYAQCDSTCHGGCYHGTLEAYLKEAIDNAQDGKSNFTMQTGFAKVCGRAQDYQKPIEFNECLHGMGHAAMFVTEMELKQSLKLCDTFSEQQHKERCYTGVFMENSSSSTSFDHASIYIKKDDPFYPCNALEEKYLSLCWQYQSSYFSIISNQDWKKVAQLCLQISIQYQDRCFRTIGTNQVGFTSSLETMKKDCDLMPSAHFKNVCVAGVVSSLSYRFVGDMQKMIDFCLLSDPQNRESCFKQIGYGILDWDKNKDVAKKECQKIPDTQGLSWCMSAI